MLIETTPEAPEVQQGMTEDAAASELLKRWGAPREEEAAAEDEAEQPEQGDAQAEDEAPEDTPQSDDSTAEIDVGGEKFELPGVPKEQAKRIEAKVKQIEAGATQKFQEASQLRQVAEAEVQAARQVAALTQQQTEMVGDYRNVMRRIQQLEQIDVNALADSDPVQLTKINAEYNQLIAAKGRIEQAAQQSMAQMKTLEAQQQQAKLQHLNDYAKRNIKGWSEEYSQTLLEFSVKDLGFDPAQLKASMSEPMLKLIDLAYKGHKVQTSQPRDKRVQSSLTLKPGSAGQSQNAKTAAEKATARLKKSGSVTDAAMALLMRSNTRKR